MARRRRSGGDGGGGGDWLNTYADMVTLLLCFFVLLYSMSTIDQQKWSFLLQSLNPEATLASPYDIDGEFEAIPPAEANIVEEQQDPYQDDATDESSDDQNFEQLEELYRILKAYIEENDLEASVELQRGDGLIFLTFRDSIFFDGYSSVLKDEGKVILDVLAGGMVGLDDYIGEIRILGHTSQASATDENDPVEDRQLSSDRAVQVLLYLQLKDILEPRKYSSTGYGQHYPAAPFDTPENRAKNRRVEIIIIQNDDSINRSLENVYGEMGIGYDDMDEFVEAGDEEALDGDTLDTGGENEPDVDSPDGNDVDNPDGDDTPDAGAADDE